MPEIEVCPADELPPGRTKIVHAGLLSVCVYNLDGQLYALEDDWAIRAKLATHVPEQYWRISTPPSGWEGLSEAD